MTATPLAPGTWVRMGIRLMHELQKNGSTVHLNEFAKCDGVVVGLTDYGVQQGPEVDVRWLPDLLRYSYDPDALIVTRTDTRSWALLRTMYIMRRLRVLNDLDSRP
jgi:hypothetical protein